MANEFKIKKGLIVTGASGGTVVDIQGSQGQLFSVTDDLSGSIFAVSDISGVPILDVNSNGTIQFSDLSAGTLVTDANGNISVSSGGGAGGPYLPLTGGTLTGNTNLTGSTKKLILKSGAQLGFEDAAPTGTIYLYNDGAATSRLNIGGTIWVEEAGNVGIGVIPEVGGNTWQHIQFGGTGNIIARKADTGLGAMFANNYYINSSNVDSAIQTGEAARVFMSAGDIRFDNAQSVSADAQVTFNTRMKILSNGNVGIGTTSPDSNLEIESSTGGVLRLTSSDTTVLTGESIGKIEFKSNDASTGGNNVMGFIDSVATNAGTRYALSFGTGDAAAAVERMRIDNLGAVRFNDYGAGTLVTDASGNITVSSGGGAGGPYLPLSGGSSVGQAMTGTLHGPGATFYVSGNNSSNLKVGDGSFRMEMGRSSIQARVVGVSGAASSLNLNPNGGDVLFTGSGNVGIGTTNPGYKLDVSSGSAVGARISTTGFTNLDLVSNRTSGNLGGLRFKQDIDAAQTGEFLGLHGGGFDWKVGDGSVAPGIKMRLDSSGNLGIGVIPNAPAGNIQLDVGDNGCGMTSRQNNELVLQANANYSTYAQTGKPATRLNLTNTGEFLFSNAPAGAAIGDTIAFTERMRIASNGVLTVGGQTSTRLVTTITENDKVDLKVIDGTDSGRAFTFSTSNSERMRITAGGNVGIGTTSPKAKLDVNGRFCVDSKAHTVTDTFTTCLTVNLSNHTGCHVVITVFGDWSGHSSAAYRGEFFLQNGANSYAEPGIILRQDDNTSVGTDQIICQIVDPTSTANPKDFQIQIRHTDTTSPASWTGQLTYTVQGQFNSIT